MATTVAHAGVNQRHPKRMRHRRSACADHQTFVIDLFRDWLRRFVEVQGIDRAMAIAAQSYSAFLPLVIVYSSMLPRGDVKSFADVLVRRFELSGATAESVQRAFAPSGA